MKIVLSVHLVRHIYAENRVFVPALIRIDIVTCPHGGGGCYRNTGKAALRMTKCELDECL